MSLLGRFLPVLPALAAVLVVGACATSAAETAAPGASSPTSQHVTVQPPPPELVSEVVDARTVQLSNGLEARILGLAAPSECWSATALKFAKDTLLGKPVRYSRASASVITLRLNNTNDDYATLAVRQGTMRAEKDDPVLTEVEQTAEKTGLGLWGPPCKGQATTSTPAPPPPAKTTTTPPAPPVEKKDCAVTYGVLKAWNGGFHAEITVRNTTQTAVSRWALHWKYTSGQQTKEAWNAAVHQYGTNVMAMSPQGPAGPATLDAGAAVTFRFNAITGSQNVAPASFMLNGKICSLG